MAGDARAGEEAAVLRADQRRRRSHYVVLAAGRDLRARPVATSLPSLTSQGRAATLLQGPRAFGALRLPWFDNRSQHRLIAAHETERENSRWVSPEEYLDAELSSPVRHEYFAGDLYAMSGASRAHNLIAGNLLAALHPHLRGGPCEVYANDMKLRISHLSDTLFYYPDVMVSCAAAGRHEYYCDAPAFIFEVLSPGTEGVDRREKLLVYGRISSLHTYLVVAQNRKEVTVHRRTPPDWWARAEVLGAGDCLMLPEIALSLPLETIYERAWSYVATRRLALRLNPTPLAKTSRSDVATRRRARTARRDCHSLTSPARAS